MISKYLFFSSIILLTLIACSKKKDTKFPLQGQYFSSEEVFSDSTRIATKEFNISNETLISFFLQNNNMGSSFYQNSSTITLRNYNLDFKNDLLLVSSGSAKGTGRLIECSTNFEKFENVDTSDFYVSSSSTIELLNKLYLDSFYTYFYYIPTSSGFLTKVKMVSKYRIYKIDGQPYLSFIRYYLKRGNSFMLTNEMNAINPKVSNYLDVGDTLIYKTYYQKLIKID